MGRGAAITALCTPLDKKASRVIEMDIQYVSSESPDEFVIGYGIYCVEHRRSLPSVAPLKRSVYERWRC